MRKLGLTLLVGSMVFAASAASAQESAAPSPDEFVCALAGECPDEAEEEEAAPAQTGTRPRVSATRGFQLSRPNESRTEPRASSSNTRPASTATRRQTRRNRQVAQNRRGNQTRPVQPAGRVDLRLGFSSGSAELSAADQARLQAFAEALKRPQLANVRVRIEGHTDSVGGRAANLTLSQRRAQAVADFLASQGIDASRFEVRGFGYDRPLPGRRASSGENRRVEAVRIS